MMQLMTTAVIVQRPIDRKKTSSLTSRREANHGGKTPRFGKNDSISEWRKASDGWMTEASFVILLGPRSLPVDKGLLLVLVVVSILRTLVFRIHELVSDVATGVKP